jgi:hypothetical protein
MASGDICMTACLLVSRGYAMMGAMKDAADQGELSISGGSI